VAGDAGEQREEREEQVPHWHGADADGAGLAAAVDADRVSAWLRARGASEAELGPLPFTIVEAAFQRLSLTWGPVTIPATLTTTDPGPASDAAPAAARGRPGGPVSLVGLRGLLLAEATPFEARDQLLGHLVGRAQAERGDAYLAPVGLLLPGLRVVAHRLFLRFVTSWYGSWWADYDDLQAELLCGLIGAIARIDPTTERLAAKLLSRAETHTRRIAYPSRDEYQNRALSWEQLDDAGAAEVSLHARPRPSGHPDLVLAAAVAAGVISKELAEVIGATYLDREPAKQVAARYGMSVSAMRTHRQRAVLRLARWLRADPERAREEGAGSDAEAAG